MFYSFTYKLLSFSSKKFSYSLFAFAFEEFTKILLSLFRDIETIENVTEETVIETVIDETVNTEQKIKKEKHLMSNESSRMNRIIDDR